MTAIPWPLTSNPGQRAQEGTGRLINVFVEPRGDKTPVWRRAPGAGVFARTPSVGAATGDAQAVGVSNVIDIEGDATGDATASGGGS